MKGLASFVLSGLVLLALGGSAFAGSADDDRNSVEARLLRLLKDRGVLSETEYKDLVELGARMRADEAMTSSALEREVHELAEKISQGAESKKAEPEAKLTYKLGKGITVKFGDDVEISVGGRLQPRFMYIAPDGMTSAGQDDRATFDVRRARVWLEGRVTKDTEVKLVFDVAPSAGALRDGYVDHKFSQALHVRFGQAKRPFARQAYTSSGAQQFVDRGSVIERFRSLAGDRSGLAMVWGEIGEKKELEWYLAATNGEALNNGAPNPVSLGTASSGLNAGNASNDDATGVEAVARVAFNPFGSPGYSEVDLERSPDPKLGIGLNFMHTPEKRGNPLAIAAGAGGIPAGALPQYDVNTYGIDFVFKYQGFFAQAEAFYREILPAGRLEGTPGRFKTATETGWYAQAGYLFGSEKNKGFELAARYGQIDFDRGIAPAKAIGGDDKIDEYTAAASYYFNGHNLKLQSDFTYRPRSLRGPLVASAATRDDAIFRIQLQVNF